MYNSVIAICDAISILLNHKKDPPREALSQQQRQLAFLQSGPPPGIPYFTWRMGQGYHPDGMVRCKRCGATDDRRKCSYCRQEKG